MNRTKFPTLRVPQWPLASSSEAVIGDGGIAMGYRTDHPRRSMNINLRSEDCFEALYLSIRFFFHDDGTFNAEMCLSDIHRVCLREAQALIKLLEQTQTRLNKALSSELPYIPIAQFGDVLMRVLAALGIHNVVEYRGIGVPDTVRPVGYTDIGLYATVATRIVNSIQRRAA